MLYVPTVVGVNLLPVIGSPFTLIVTVPLLFVMYVIVTSVPTLMSLIGAIATVVLVFFAVNDVSLYPAV